MKLYKVYEALSPKIKVIPLSFSLTRIPGIIYRWQCLDELVNIYNGEWALTPFDTYGEEDHDPEYDDMYFKSFSTHETPDQNETFFDDVLIAYDEAGLERLGGGSKLVDYVYDVNTEENEKRLISPNEMLPAASLGGKYWKLIKTIYVPKSNFDQFNDKFLPQFDGHENLLPPWVVIRDC